MFRAIERLLQVEGWQVILKFFQTLLKMVRLIAEGDPFIININYTTKFILTNIYHTVY